MYRAHSFLQARGGKGVKQAYGVLKKFDDHLILADAVHALTKDNPHLLTRIVAVKMVSPQKTPSSSKKRQCGSLGITRQY